MMRPVKCAVQLDINTFEKIEEILEDHGLARCMADGDEDEDEILNIEEAMGYYGAPEKAE